MDQSAPELYISCDVETDGPIPGEYSMLSFGLCVAGKFEAGRFQRVRPDATPFYTELAPIGERFDPDALAVNGLDRTKLAREADHPQVAMQRADKWVREMAGDTVPVLVAAPVAFDWMFLYWYFVRFAPHGSPFSFSQCVDVRSYFQGVTGASFAASGRSAWPRELRGTRPHTHHALDDAIEQAEMFANVVEWRQSVLGSVPSLTSE